MRNVPYVRLCIQVLSIRFLVFIIAFFIMIPLLYGIEEKSWEERYLECIEGNCLNGKGTMIYYSSQKYIGEFKDGKRHGQGVLNILLDEAGVEDGLVRAVRHERDCEHQQQQQSERDGQRTTDDDHEALPGGHTTAS